MTASNFAACLRIVLKHEGGYVDHPRDPGGATNLGVTIGTWSDWIGRRATKAEVRALTVADVTPLYRRRYWDAVDGDALPAGVDLAVFDPAVNSGPARAKRWLRQGLRDDAVATIRAICAIRMGFLRSLRTFNAFGRGWTRRVAEIEVAAVRMAGATPAQVRAEGERATRAADRNATGARATAPIAVTAPAVAPAADPSSPELWIIAAVVIVLAGGLIAFLAHRASVERARATAHLAPPEA